MYVKKSPHYFTFFADAVKKVTYGDLDEKIPVEFKQAFLKESKDEFQKNWRTSLIHKFEKDLNAAYTTSERNLTPIWSFHLELPEQELPKEIFQDSSELIYERRNGPIPKLLGKRTMTIRI